jgi:hypothetical protein
MRMMEAAAEAEAAAADRDKARTAAVVVDEVAVPVPAEDRGEAGEVAATRPNRNQLTARNDPSSFRCRTCPSSPRIVRPP